MPAPTTMPKTRWTPRTLTFLFIWWIGGLRPSILRFFVLGNLRNNLIKRGILRGPAKHLAEVRADFERRAAGGQFQEHWFDRNIIPWCATFAKAFGRADSLRILEIGSWEGRSTLFFLTYFKHADLTAVDTWAGSEEWEYHATGDLSDLEARFDHNVGLGGGTVTKRKGSSLEVLPQLLSENQTFDLIYVDGSHFADDALTDAINAWRLLRPQGIIIFDDVMWPAYARPRANTAWAIHQFLKFHPGEYKVLHAAYQVILEKKTDFDDPLAEWVHRPAVPTSIRESAADAQRLPG
ncbi:class I SAM-dependent methyltransferase [Mycolicibacterium tusciae]|uniref:class I SAM-dependent methyltransferase n=1 Tax=Mycolicibacterium tusciae TaxID=75922 RepID=UPI00024A1EEE|nr:class I SAM-dependent methyltransferase [Mycolicibacterium tusciae]